MKMILDVLLMAALFVVFIQDLKTRMITLLLLLLVAHICIIKFIVFYNSQNNRMILLSNVLFILGQTVFLYLYVVYIRKTKVPFFQEIIGWGDLLMMGSMAFVFPLPQLLVYLLVSLGMGLFFFFLAKTIYNTVTIPLAGIMALVFLCNLGIFYCSGYLLIETFSL